MKTDREYNDQPFTPAADELFESWDLSTALLVETLANAISPHTDHLLRAEFLRQWHYGEGLWCRGVVCKALVDMGECVHTINQRRS